VKQVEEKIWLVSFMRYDVGFFDHETCRIESAENPFAAKVLPMCPEWTPFGFARPERFELPTSWFVARRSIQLSYGRTVKANLSAGTSGIQTQARDQ
jgi:hypothetical protein